MLRNFEGRIREIVEEAYKAGYKDGKAQGEETEHAPAYKTVQAIRDAIVEEAKADIEGLKTYSGGNRRDVYPVLNSIGLVTDCDAEFIVNKEKRTVVVLLRGAVTKKVYVKGIAKCDPKDCFNVHIGKAIALRRALGKGVPQSYLSAPQPTEYRVGDFVSRPRWEGMKEVVDTDLLIGSELYSCIRLSTVQNPRVDDFYIADDSRE